MAKLRVLSGDDVRAAVSMSEAIVATRAAFGQLSAGTAVVPVRTQWAVTNGTALVMPAFVPESGGLGAKILSVFPANPARGLPTIHALVALLDADTGQAVALMDGTYLTALRTGAASGVATDLLAARDAHTAAVFGAGTQGRTQLLALCTVRAVQTAWIYDRSQERAEAFARELAGQGPIPRDLRVAASPAEAVREARLIATATTSQRPVFADADLLPGVHICAVGGFQPDMQEIPAATVGRARVFVDQRAAVLAEAGDLLIPIDQGILDPAGLHEIGEVVNGQVPGRESAEQVTLFKSVGVAVQDIATAIQALRKAEEQGLGTIVEM